MSFKMYCPNCMSSLNVTEKAFGKVVPCPACKKLVTVPAGEQQPLPQGHLVDGPPARRDAGYGTYATPEAARPLPAAMPPMPGESPPAPSPGNPLGFLEPGAGSGPAAGPASLPERQGSPGTMPDAPRRPAGLVWVVFYLSIAGVLWMIGGFVLTFGGSFLGGIAGAMDDFGPRRSGGAVGSVIAEALGAGGLILFHLGLLTEVACYGLWTFRRWGLSLAKIVADIYALLSLIGLLAAIIMRAGIVSGLVGFAISVGIVVYLYGSSNLSDRVQQVFSRVRQAGDHHWDGYQ
jgi:hypothetical protein